MSELQSPKRHNLAEKIVDIMFLKHAFEDNPLTERFLSEQFDTSRTPVRDELKILESDDLIVRRKKKGVFLKKPTPKTIAELYDLRIVLEGFSIRQAIETASESDLAFLEQAATDFDEGQSDCDFVKTEKANIGFHTKIIELSRNEMLIGMMRNFNIIRKAFQFSYSLRPERQAIASPCSHQDIIEHLRRGDADVCERLLKQHVQVGKQRMLEQALGFKIGS